MSELDFLHFNQLKNEVQAKYLLSHTPSAEEISKWKGIDIIYFQEDLRKTAKGNISEKTFYTYFKSPANTKLPRIDMLNILSIYAGYSSWYDFKKNHLFANEILSESEAETELEEEIAPVELPNPNSPETISEIETEKTVLQNILPENETVTETTASLEPHDLPAKTNFTERLKKRLWLGISAVLALLLGLLGFKDEIFSRKFYYSFVDADRNSRINAELQVKILKENESPILYTAKPNEPFAYTTKSKTLTMVVSSPFYKTDTIKRNLETAPEAESIELVPNDYAQMLFYYSKSIKDLKMKRDRLERLIGNDALIYQVFDNDTYGVETMDKQRYISLVTLPTTSLEKLEVIDTRTDQYGRINMIKFRILTDEKQ